MSKAGIKKAFTESQYTPVYLRTKDIKVLSQDYTRSRDILQKRYKRLKKAGFETNFTRSVESWGGLPKLSELKKLSGGDEQQLKNEVSYWLSEFAVFERQKSTTVKAQREKRKELSKALKEAGYNIPAAKLDQFGEFMDYVRMTSLDKVFYNQTFRSTDTGYRSRRDQRTEKEKKALMSAFTEWQKTKALDILKYNIVP